MADNPAVRYCEITAANAGQRVDNFLITQLKGCPKSLIYRIIRKGEVRVNKKRVKAEYKLQEGDQVRIPPVRVAAPDEPKVISKNKLQDLESKIIYEDESLLVVDKPAGLAVHGGSGISLGLIEMLRQLRPKCQQLELAHRLDRDTSGLIITTKQRSMLRFLHEAMRSGKVQKYYECMVAGHWPEKLTLVDAPLRKNTLKSGERIVRVSDDGKPSQTAVEILTRHRNHTHLGVTLLTGRTHQIRVHTAHSGCAILGDNKYAPELAQQLAGQAQIKRLLLHAARLAIPQMQGPDIVLQAATPEAFAQACVNLEALA